MQAHDINRIKNDSRDYTCYCAECEKAFEATRSDASFCSSRCRVAFSRRPQKLQNALAALEQIAAQVNEMSNRYSKNQQVYEAVLELQRKIGKSLGNFES